MARSTTPRSRGCSRSRPRGRARCEASFRATIDLAEPRQSSATGALEGDRIDILERWGIPVAIERLRIDVDGDAVQIHEGAIAVAGERLALTGSVTLQPKTFGLDLSVTADAIDVERLLRAFPLGGATPAAAGWNLPVDGRIAVDAKSVTYGTHVVRPVSGTVALAPDRIVADVKDAQLCGIALPLSAVLVPGNVNVTGRIEARAQPLAGTMTCLLGEHYAMTGTLDLDADLSANGPVDALARTARGTFQLKARDGQIQRAPVMARILSLDVVAGLLRARPSELMASGLDYSELAVAGTLDAGRVRIANGTLTRGGARARDGRRDRRPCRTPRYAGRRRAVRTDPGRDAAGPGRGPRPRHSRRRDPAERHRRPARSAGRAARPGGDRPEPGEPAWRRDEDAGRPARSVRRAATARAVTRAWR